MGAKPAKEFKDKYFLHQTSFMDNKLQVLLSDSYKLQTFELFLNQQKFRCFGQQTIALPSGAIYMIGGRSFCSNQLSDDAVLTAEPPMNLYTTDEVFKINLNKHTDYQIELSQSRAIKPLPEPRHSHLLLYAAPYIYVIGGKVDEVTHTKSCLRLHTKKKEWSSIQDLDLAGSSLSNLSGVNVNNEKLIVFDGSKSPLPRIFQYTIDTDVWVQIVIDHKNKNTFIPPSINLAAYHIADDKILLLSGEQITEDKKQNGYFYFFDLNKEKIEGFKEETALNFALGCMQGKQNYVADERVHLKFEESQMYFFDKRMESCESMELFDYDLPRWNDDLDDSLNACCSRKRMLLF